PFALAGTEPGAAPRCGRGPPPQAGCHAVLLAEVPWLLRAGLRRLLGAAVAPRPRPAAPGRQLLLLRELEPLAGLPHRRLHADGLPHRPRAGGQSLDTLAPPSHGRQPRGEPWSAHLLQVCQLLPALAGGRAERRRGDGLPAGAARDPADRHLV